MLPAKSVIEGLTYDDLLRLAKAAKKEGTISFSKAWITKEQGIIWDSYTTNYPKRVLVTLLAEHAGQLADLPQWKEIVERRARRERSGGKARADAPAAIAEREKLLPPLKGRSLDEMAANLFPGVVGMAALKVALIETIYLPLNASSEAKRFGLSRAPGLLLHGPPGNGKTFVLRKFCEQCGFALTAVSGTSFMTKWFGDTKRKIRAMFARAAKKAPAMILIDEIDAIVPNRNSFQNAGDMGHVNEFLSQLDGFRKREGVAVVGTTNRLGSIDPAIRRSGRLGVPIWIGNPEGESERRDLLANALTGIPTGNDADLGSIARLVGDCSRADIDHICQQAARAAFLRLVTTGVPDTAVVHADLLESLERWKINKATKDE